MSCGNAVADFFGNHHHSRILNILFDIDAEWCDRPTETHPLAYENVINFSDDFSAPTKKSDFFTFLDDLSHDFGVWDIFKTKTLWHFFLGYVSLNSICANKSPKILTVSCVSHLSHTHTPRTTNTQREAVKNANNFFFFFKWTIESMDGWMNGCFIWSEA